VVTGNASDRVVATNLLNFGHIHAGYSQPWVVGAGPALTAERPWAPVGDAFGIKSWTTNDAAYRLFYKDDDARGLLVGGQPFVCAVLPRFGSLLLNAAADMPRACCAAMVME
jgi:hypothetical protein